MTFRIPYYLIVGERAVRVTPTQEGGFDVQGYEWVSGGWVRDLHAWESLFDGGMDARSVDEATHRGHVEALKRQPAADPDRQLLAIVNRMVNNVNSRDEENRLEREAALQKALIEYNGDVSRIGNIESSSIAYDSVDSIQKATSFIVEEMKKNGLKVTRIVDRFERPLIDGWRDILLNIKYPNGHVVEMQLWLKALGDVRSENHALYDEQWAINERRLVEDRPFAAPEARRILELLAEQNQLYERALGTDRKHR